MPLNFTGRAQPQAVDGASRAGRTPVVILSCFAAAAVLAGVVFAAALRQHGATAQAPTSPLLVGTDRAFASTVPPRPSGPALAPAAEPWIMHKAAEPAPAARPPAAAASPEARNRARMLAALRQVPHGTITLSVEDDPGAQAYARKLADLFHEAGWIVDESSTFGSGPPRHGLAAAFGVSPSDEAAREAFDAVGFQLEPPPRDAGIIRTPEIFVGVPIISAPAR